MNYRILELYEIAVSETKRFHKRNPKISQEELNEYCAEQFAHMIIEECAEICEEIFYKNHSNDPDFEEWYGSEEGEAILESFGMR